MADKTTTVAEDEKLQKKEYEAVIKQKKHLVERAANTVRDDVKYGIISKDALVVEPLHKLGVPTGAIQRGAVAISDTSALLTKSDKQICEYYANYDKITEAKKKEVGEIVKAVDRQEESLMAAKADLSSEKLKYSAFKSHLKQTKGVNQDKQSERLAKANALSSSLSDETTKDGLTGITADYLGLD